MEEKITVKKIRFNNQKNALTAISEHNGITRHDLAVLNGVSLMTITNVVESLLTSGVIYEKKTATNIGRCPGLLFLREELGYFLIINIKCKQLAEYTFYSIKKAVIFRKELTFCKDISEEEYCTKFSEDIFYNTPSSGNLLGIGIAAESIISLNDRLNCLSHKLKDFYNCENIIVEREVNIEAFLESVKNPEDKIIAYISIGNNICGSLIINNKIFKGNGGICSGEIGQILLGDPESPIEFTKMASISAIENHINAGGTNYTLDEIITGYLSGDSPFKEHIDCVIKTVNMVLLNLLFLAKPDRMVIKCPSKPYCDLIISSFRQFIKNYESYFLVEPAGYINSVLLPCYDKGIFLEGLFYKLKRKYIESLC